MKEKWKDVVGFEGKYEVSSLGRVRSLARVTERRVVGILPDSGKEVAILQKIRVPGKVLQGWEIKHGYRHVGLHREPGKGNLETFAVHRLMLEAFVGSCPPGMECRHLDDNPRNNNLSNLCWGTPKENAEDRKRNGNSHYTASPKGEEQYQAKLTEAKVRYIRKTYADGTHTVKELAEMMRVKKITIYSVTSGKAWKHVK